MMEFVVLTLAVMTGTLLASGLALFIVMQPKVMKLYMKQVNKTVQQVYEIPMEEAEDL
jgi:hypothetical protein